MKVGRADLEGHLQQLAAGIADPVSGLYGPGSAMWEVSRESILFLGGGRAALMQLAHPWVAQGVSHHSHTKDDLAGRFQRTFMNVFALVFGAQDEAMASARRVHNIHQRITGTMDEAVGPYAAGDPYAANDEHALMWVHATLLDTSVHVYELVLGPLGPARLAALYEDSKRFARLFGISDRCLPADWPAFRAYMNEMLSAGQLAVGKAGAELCQFLLTPPRRAVIPMWRWYEAMTAGLLPETLRREYGLRFGRREKALFASSIAALKRSYKRIPTRLRYLPAYVDAQRRVQGRQPDWFGRLAERFVLSAFQT